MKIMRDNIKPEERKILIREISTIRKVCAAPVALWLRHAVPGRQARAPCASAPTCSCCLAASPSLRLSLSVSPCSPSVGNPFQNSLDQAQDCDFIVDYYGLHFAEGDVWVYMELMEVGRGVYRRLPTPLLPLRVAWRSRPCSSLGAKAEGRHARAIDTSSHAGLARVHLPRGC